MADAPALHVTDIQQEPILVPVAGGKNARGYRIHFTTPAGTRAQIEMVGDEYTPHKVAQAISNEVWKVEGVHAIEHSPLPPPQVS